jgi:hypothetical protein
MVEVVAFKPKKEPVPITNKQMESMLKVIPAGWSISFSRELLRPDKMAVAVKRSDQVQIELSMTGAMMLENPDNDFLPLITMACAKLMQYKKGATR